MVRASWSESALQLLAEQLHMQRQNGNYGDNGLKTQGVDAIIRAFKEKRDEKLSRAQIKGAIYTVRLECIDRHLLRPLMLDL
jgi:hypothetical protein